MKAISVEFWAGTCGQDPPSLLYIIMVLACPAGLPVAFAPGGAIPSMASPKKTVPETPLEGFTKQNSAIVPSPKKNAHASSPQKEKLNGANVIDPKIIPTTLVTPGPKEPNAQADIDGETPPVLKKFPKAVIDMRTLLGDKGDNIEAIVSELKTNIPLYKRILSAMDHTLGTKAQSQYKNITDREQRLKTIA